jgi:hypothetical protein
MRCHRLGPASQDRAGIDVFERVHSPLFSFAKLRDFGPQNTQENDRRRLTLWQGQDSG